MFTSIYNINYSPHVSRVCTGFLQNIFKYFSLFIMGLIFLGWWLASHHRLSHYVKSDKVIVMDDPKLIFETRKWLIPPLSFRNNFIDKKLIPKSEINENILAETFRSFADGFFIEYCAGDGDNTNSYTTWLETTLGWKGSLIEPDPTKFEFLLQKNRHAWIGNFCLASDLNPKTMKFNVIRKLRLHRRYKNKEKAHVYEKRPAVVPCFPLYTVLLALNRTTIDYLRLEAEGHELDIMKAVPFDQVLFKVIAVQNEENGKYELLHFMQQNGYTLYRPVSSRNSGDDIFIHKSVHLKVSSLKKQLSEKY